MKELQEKILKEGTALNETVLKVDGFLNHQVDPLLMQKIGEEFANYFEDRGITKVFTIESSGIAPAVMAAIKLDVPMVILKKQQSKILNGEVYQTKVTSFTKGTSYELTVSGIGIVIEKSFQPGRKKLDDRGFDVYSLARISRLDKGVIEFVEEA